MLPAIKGIKNIEDRISNAVSAIRDSKFVIRVVTFIGASAFALLLAPVVVSAQSCPGAPSQFPTACQPSCGTGYGLAANYLALDQDLAVASCGSNQCCLQLGDSACDAEAKKNFQQSGKCKSSCGQGEVASRLAANTCTSGQKCCYGGGAAVAAPAPGACIGIPGVTSACKASPDKDEISADQSPYWAKFVVPGTTCKNQICAIKTGSALCAAVAKDQKKEGSYSCVASSSDCVGAPFDQQDNLCGPGAVCCIAKVGASASGGPTAAVTLLDPLSGASLPQVIGNVIRTFAGIAGALALLMFVYGGIMWILSGGEGGKVTKAKDILRNASIGLILIFGAYFFTSAIVTGILANPK